MKPLSERDENRAFLNKSNVSLSFVGMKPLSERDENLIFVLLRKVISAQRRNEATL